MDAASQLLQQYFGYDSFRPLQKEIIGDVLNKHDVLAIMPTGSGKSLCYQIPALIEQNATTIVISPLIALMKDQVDGLKQNGIKAAFLNSSLSSSEQQNVIHQLLQKELSLLYVAPERLSQETFLKLLQQIPIRLFAIDEAHCISEWGHDFRPDYRELQKLRELFPTVPLLALTATATVQVKNDIAKQLNLHNEKFYQASFDRKNLTYIVKQKQHPHEQVLEYLQNHPDESGILYCQSRNDVNDMAEFLQHHNIKALPYHAGLDHALRQKHQESFIREDANIIVATIAFGMGIDKPNVRYVIHVDLPKSLEGYYQETGRAGRDGLPSDCVLLYSYGDTRKSEFFIRQKEPKQQKFARQQLHDMVRFATYNKCRRIALLGYFGETYQQNTCKACDNCVTPKETFDATILAQKILSCVYRIEERFGIKYLIDVLTGVSSERMMTLGHDRLSTFGIITDYTPQQLQIIVRELIDAGYLQLSGDQYPVVQLTEKSNHILLKKEIVRLSKVQQKEQKGKKNFFASTDHQELFETLRILRKRLADEQQVPPYVIFPDTSLIEMARVLPQTETEFRTITGVGQQKLQKYGIVFLKEIKNYQRKHNIFSTISSFFKKPTKSKAHTVDETLMLFRQGLTIAEIAKQRGFATSTVASHLEDAYICGEDLDLQQFVTTEKQEKIKKVFEKTGFEKLAPVKNVLGDTYSYDEIRFVRAMTLREKNT